mgnify:CR=1 FL=1
MAKQTSIITLNGKIGGISFYKTKDGYMAREKGGIAKSRIMSDPRFARTRENLREFAENAKSSKLLRNAIRPVIIKVSDAKHHLRLVRRMMEILKTDPVNLRGDRLVKEGDWSIISGFELNYNAKLASTLFADYSITDDATNWTVDIPAMMPTDFLAIPEGATHFKIFIAGASMDFDSEEKQFTEASSPELPVNELSTAINLTVDKTTLTSSHKVFVLGVEFIQLVNGQQYSIQNGAYNAAAILSVENA